MTVDLSVSAHSVTQVGQQGENYQVVRSLVLNTVVSSSTVARVNGPSVWTAGKLRMTFTDFGGKMFRLRSKLSITCSSNPLALQELKLNR